MQEKPELSVIIPAYNEANRIGATLEKISVYLGQRGISYEIIVVSDGSDDSTDSIVNSYAGDNTSIRLISYQPNQGKGYAVRMGMIDARAENVLLTDADLATPIEDIELLEKSAESGVQVVVASRALKESTIIGWRPWYRELSGIVFNKFVRLFAVRGIHDTQCGFKYFTDDSARKIFSVARVNGFGFDVEALYLASKFGFNMGEVAARWNNSPSTKVSVLKHTLPMLLDIMRVRVNDWKKIYDSPPADD